MENVTPEPVSNVTSTSTHSFVCVFNYKMNPPNSASNTKPANSDDCLLQHKCYQKRHGREECVYIFHHTTNKNLSANATDIPQKGRVTKIFNPYAAKLGKIRNTRNDILGR